MDPETERGATFYQVWSRVPFDDPMRNLMMKGGPQTPKFLANRELWQSSRELFAVEGDEREFASAPEKIKKAGVCLFAHNHEADRPQNPIEVPRGTSITELEDILIDGAKAYVDKITQKTTKTERG